MKAISVILLVALISSTFTVSRVQAGGDETESESEAAAVEDTEAAAVEDTEAPAVEYTAETVEDVEAKEVTTTIAPEAEARVEEPEAEETAETSVEEEEQTTTVTEAAVEEDVEKATEEEPPMEETATTESVETTTEVLPETTTEAEDAGAVEPEIVSEEETTTAADSITENVNTKGVQNDESTVATAAADVAETTTATVSDYIEDVETTAGAATEDDETVNTANSTTPLPILEEVVETTTEATEAFVAVEYHDTTTENTETTESPDTTPEETTVLEASTAPVVEVAFETTEPDSTEDTKTTEATDTEAGEIISEETTTASSPLPDSSDSSSAAATDTTTSGAPTTISVASTDVGSTEGAASSQAGSTEGGASTAAPSGTTSVAPVPEKSTLAGIATTPAYPVTSPCHSNNHQTLDDARRYYSSETEPNCDKALTEGWYHFLVEGKEAVVASTCLKAGACGVQFPYRIALAQKDFPLKGVTKETHMCTHMLSPFGTNECCVAKQPIKVHNCGPFYLFHTEPTTACPSAVCVKLPDEHIPHKFYAAPPPPFNTLITELTQAEKEDAVTMTFNIGKYDYNQEQFVEKLLTILKQMAEQTEGKETVDDTSDTDPTPETSDAPGSDAPGNDVPGSDAPGSDAPTDSDAPLPLKKRAVEGKPEVEVVIVTPTPVQRDDGKVEVAVIIKRVWPDGRAEVMNKEQILNMKYQIKDAVQKEFGHEVDLEDIRPGLTSTVLQYEPEREYPVNTSPRNDGLFYTHLGLFVTAIIVAILCLLVFCAACVFVKVKQRQNRHYIAGNGLDKATLTMEEGRKGKGLQGPLSDTEILRDEAPALDEKMPLPGNGDGYIIPTSEQIIDEKPNNNIFEDTKL